MRHPSAWYIGDRATVRNGHKSHNVTINRFSGRLVWVTYPNGLIGSCRYSALEPIAEQDTRSYSIVPKPMEANYRDWLVAQGYAA